MFKNWRMKKTESTPHDRVILAPASGSVIKMEAVSDQVFSKLVMGPGFGLVPTERKIYAPFSGKITMISSTKHAIGMITLDGLEILIHLGVETVDLDGKPFVIFPKVDHEVVAGDELATMNISELRHLDRDPTIIVAITNASKLGVELKLNYGNVTKQEIIGDYHLEGK